MKKPFYLATALIIAATTAGCSKDEPVELAISSHRNNAVISRPLPMTVRGRITNFDTLPPEQQQDLHIYLIEQGSGEDIWHIEPAVRVSQKGTWRGLTWLGNRKQGNRKSFTLCAFTSPQKLDLNNGNHPVKEKPENTGEVCITVKRRDR